MNYLAFRQWAIDNWYLLPVFLGMAVIVFVLLRVQNSLRDQSAAGIERLLVTDPALCAERLENNKLFRTVFRKPVIELWKLQAYMQLGEDDKIETALRRLRGMKLEPRDKIEFNHSSGMKLGDVADIMIDNCCPLEDALVAIPGYYQKVGASSTVAVITIAQSIASETALLLEKMGHKMYIFVSPNVVEIPKEYMHEVYAEYRKVVFQNSNM